MSPTLPVLVAFFSLSRCLIADDTLQPRALTSPAHVYDKFEAALNLPGSYQNPFDFNEVTVQAHFVSASGKEAVVDGFYYQDFTQTPSNAPGQWDQVVERGSPEWRIRYTPEEAGTYTWWATVQDAAGLRSSPKGAFTVAAGASPGFIELSQFNKTNFQFQDGSPYFPVGLNLAFMGRGGGYAMLRYLDEASSNGVNFARFWLGPLSFPLERATVPPGGITYDPKSGYVEDYLIPELNFRTQNGAKDADSGLGKIDLANAWRIDAIIDWAGTRQMYLQLCLEASQNLSESFWPLNPYNAANGGMLQKPAEFFTNPAAKDYFKRRMRYIVARYGAEVHVMSWELFNEVDEVDGYAAHVKDVRDWHAEMAAYLKSIDPYHHLVTTSGAFPLDAGIESLPTIDYSQDHNYGSFNSALQTATLDARQSALYQKPYLIGEFGLMPGPRSTWLDDPKGLSFHQALWASLASPGAGTVMSWWWDNFIEPRHLFLFYAPVARFARGVPWNRVQWQPVAGTSLCYQKEGTQPPSPLTLIPANRSWAPAFYNMPQTLTISPNGGIDPTEGVLSQLIHGKAHPHLRNPVTFMVDYPRDGKFTVTVMKVSNWGGAILEVSLDGNPVLRQVFLQDGPWGKGDGSTKYNGDYTIDAPAGKHAIKVDNLGQDVVEVTYTFTGCFSRALPDLAVYGMIGDGTLGTLYLQNRSYNWVQLDRGEASQPVAPSLLTLSGFKPGKYRAEFWNTESGNIVDTQEIKTSPNGLVLRLPQIITDLACKIVPSKT